MKRNLMILIVGSILGVVMNAPLAHAEIETSSLNSDPDDIRTSETKGIYVEALYSVLKTQGSNGNNKLVNPTVILNEPLYALGFGFGYRHLRNADFGYELGGQLIQDNNSLGTENHAFYQLNGNLTYSLSPLFYTFAGPSINYLNFYDYGFNETKSVKSSPTLGGQIGVGYIYKGFSANISYQDMPFKSQLEYTGTSGQTVPVNNDFRMSGFVTKIGYNF